MDEVGVKVQDILKRVQVIKSRDKVYSKPAPGPAKSPNVVESGIEQIKKGK